MLTSEGYAENADEGEHDECYNYDQSVADNLGYTLLFPVASCVPGLLAQPLYLRLPPSS